MNEPPTADLAVRLEQAYQVIWGLLCVASNQQEQAAANFPEDPHDWSSPPGAPTPGTCHVLVPPGVSCNRHVAHAVVWSDRWSNVCENHLVHALVGARRDGYSDRTDNPLVDGVPWEHHDSYAELEPLVVAEVLRRSMSDPKETP